jgi:hypothetical protein
MEVLIDMVHHNPGEKYFETRFSSAGMLAECGYNGQVFKNINCAVSFKAFDSDVFPAGSEEEKWLNILTVKIKAEIKAARDKGLKVYYHIDLFVLPKRLVEKYKERICYEGTSRISVERDMTLEIHRIMFDELFEEFPGVDGLIFRVGETYLYDLPYHLGNGPIRQAMYEESKDDPEIEKQRYVMLINFLRSVICDKHKKKLIFRTWDCYPDKFHANPEYYLEVTNRIKPHELLYFSMKHTALDFWRNVKFNECITRGFHKQIIEVQCQREYEGKGAYPDYIMHGVINGFKENKVCKGLRNVMSHPLVKGLYTWSRGGGWYGPYIQNELWCDLNVYVLSAYAVNPGRREADIFNVYSEEVLGLEGYEVGIFRRLCLLSSLAVLKGRYCEAFDKSLNESAAPTNLWMRDDRIGGLTQLKPVFEYLWAKNLFDKALAEKEESVKLWLKIKTLEGQLNIKDFNTKEYIRISVEYGLRLYKIVYYGWKVLISGFIGDKTGLYDKRAIAEAIMMYDESWEAYRELGKQPSCSTLYNDMYLNLPGEDLVLGMGYSVDKYRKI